MAYQARMLLDSVTENGSRLLTFELTFPRMILSEFNTHCMISRNSASSRAVPVKRKLFDLLDDPFVPIEFGRNQSGMSAAMKLDEQSSETAREIWLDARDAAIWSALELIFGKTLVRERRSSELNPALIESLFEIPAEDRLLDVHKQVVNRLLEPFMWQTVIATATDWSNFFALRASESAQPEIQAIARLMLEVRDESEPRIVAAGEWHAPLLLPDELSLAKSNPREWCLVSAGRCARVSYLTHLGVRSIDADLSLAARLLEAGHMSPFEHVARAMSDDELALRPYVGKLRGWVPFRSMIPNEQDFSLVLAARSVP